MAVWETKSVIYTRVFMNTVLAAFGVRPAAALVASPKLRLSKDPAFLPTVSSAIADFTGGECDFTGYTPGGVVPTFSVPVNLDPQVQGLVADSTFVEGTATPQVANNVTGWWVDDGTNVIAAEAFNAGPGLPMSNPGDYIDLHVVLPVGLLENAPAA